MCGILFYTGSHSLHLNHPALQNIKHRGPDNVEIKHFNFNNKFITLGHRRLSIIELSKSGNQPMNYLDYDSWITFNGEIYNYIEIRDKLLQNGYIFKTNSDTEVLLASYFHWGIDCVNHFNGMFSFVIWDNLNKKLFAARDRYGIKPMYYWNNTNGFAISSEIKQFTDLKEFKKELNQDVAYQFLQYGDFSYNNETLWKHVFEIEPGCFLDINFNIWKPGDKFKIKKWYKLKFSSRKTELTEKEVYNKFIEYFKESINKRLNADVKVGALVSGGLDSSSIISLISKLKNTSSDIQTFSMIYNEIEFSEKKYIDDVVNELNLKSKIITFEHSNYFKDLDKIIWHNDLPTVGRSIVPHFNIYKNIDSNLHKVILEGQGADEYMAGYGNFHIAYMCELINKFNLIQLIKEYPEFRKTRKGSFLSDAKAILQYNYPKLYNLIKKTNQSPELFNFKGVDKVQYIKREQNNVNDVFKTRFIILRSILHSVDRISMSKSVETRVPFLDHNLIEFVMSLPFTFLIKDGVRKSILRESMKDYLPDNIYNRKEKVGFSSPENFWFSNQLKQIFIKEIESAILLPFVNKKNVKLKLEEFLKNDSNLDKTLIRLVNFNRWIKIFDIKI